MLTGHNIPQQGGAPHDQYDKPPVAPDRRIAEPAEPVTRERDPSSLVQRKCDVGDELCRLVKLAGQQEVFHRVHRQRVVPEPLGGNAMQHSDGLRSGDSFQFGSQEITEQRVIPKPRTLMIQRHQKEVGAFYPPQVGARVVDPQQVIAQRHRQPLQD